MPSDLLRQVAVIRRRRVHHAKLVQLFKNFFTSSLTKRRNKLECLSMIAALRDIQRDDIMHNDTSITALSMMTFSMMTFSMMTFSMMTFSMMTLSMMTL